MNSRVLVSVGSNVNAKSNVSRSIDEMRSDFGTLSLSPVYQSASVGFKGDDFLNMVVRFETEYSIYQVVDQLHEIERIMGRDRRQPKFSSRPIDLDLLTFNDLILDEDNIQVPRHEILMNGFVLRPMQDLVPEELHPEVGKTYRQLWQEMEIHAPTLTLLNLEGLN
jgi:2-amino-4-hydroxy-6-hydroxymethyldihydropteridine diphosphokinase